MSGKDVSMDFFQDVRHERARLEEDDCWVHEVV